jgi:hypothetical protein
MGWLDAWKQTEESRLLQPEPGALVLDQAEIRHGGGRQLLYAQILQREVEKRSRCRWHLSPAEQPLPMVRLGVEEGANEHPEGFRIRTTSTDVVVTGFSERGLLFGIGRLLREMSMDWEQTYATPLTTCCFIDSHLEIVSWPRYSMRQHQIAYRPKTNSYDSFTPEQMRQEILDQALFGCNAIELIPPGLDDAEQSPHFTVPWLEMLTLASGWCEQLDLDVSIWFPAFQEHAKTQWDTVFFALRRLDVLFVPGGDPGGRPPKELFRIVKEQARVLHETYFPKAQVWVSSQYGLGVSVDLKLEPWKPRERLEEWLCLLSEPWVEAYLTGVVYSPWTAMPLEEFRARVPQRYPVRNYPDICHSASCEFPVDGWDATFFMANLREGINPRPRTFARIIADQAPLTIGCGCYSEGVNDDLNKHVWTVLHWGPDQKGPLVDPNKLLDATLLQYASFLCQVPREAARLREGIYRLEQHWFSNLCDPSYRETVLATRDLFRDITDRLSPRQLRNWHLNLYLFRAEYDAFLVERHHKEEALVRQAMATLCRDGTPKASAVESALLILDQPSIDQDLCSTACRLHEYSALLFSEIGYQTSLRWGGQHRQRGAFFDMAWVPSHDVEFLRQTLEQARTEAEPDSFLSSELLGPKDSTVLWYGSFGERVGDGALPLHRVVPPYRKMTLGEDPTYFGRPLVEHLAGDSDEVLRLLKSGSIRRSWRSWLVCIWPESASLTLRFPLSELPDVPTAVRLTYLGSDLNRLGGDWAELGRSAQPTRLTANGALVHDFLQPSERTRTREFSLPPMTSDFLELTFEPKDISAVTVNHVPLPIAELWLLGRADRSNLLPGDSVRICPAGSL